MEKQKNAVGRRKEAVTRVFLSKGDGKIIINDKDYKQYFTLVYLQNQVELPLKTVELADKYDVKINATGGGIKGQAEAAKLGIARALLEVNAEFRPALKAAGLLRRDPRAVERKKPGRKKARRSYQFSKR
ncbi:MAG TPA: 30S ribosomal protein S9 [Puia sp.]|jgi:small subunit ribosomal protein S9|nr:30S ribosomal protein S9 [Puia sp.]